MGSFKPSQLYDPLDLEVLDRVYEAAWARVEAAEPDRDLRQDEDRQKALRQLGFTMARGHPVEFDALFEKLNAATASWLKTTAGDEMFGAVRHLPGVPDRRAGHTYERVAERVNVLVLEAIATSIFAVDPFVQMIGRHHGIDRMARINAIASAEVGLLVAELLQEVGRG